MTLELNGIDVDCIEKDADLRQILKYNFSSDRKRKIRHRKYEAHAQRCSNPWHL